MRTLFCGREAELEILQSAWARATATENRHPQVVALVGDRGIGKTRLIQEFYSWLSTCHDGGSALGYWPNDLGQDIDNLRLHVEPAACHLERPMPFLWWALRLADPGGYNTQVSSALDANLRFLQPHLERIERKIEHTQRWYDTARVLGKLGIDTALEAAHIAIFAKVGETIFELLKLSEQAKTGHSSPQELIQKQRLDLVDRVVSDLSKIASGSLGVELPICIVIDDAQFSASDPSTTDFFSKLLADANLACWPLLVIVTCWVEDWLDESRGDRVPLLQSLRRYGDSPWWRAVTLGPVTDLGPMLAAALPGLSDDQARAVLARAAGNPRYLDEIIRHLQDRPRYFVDRDLRKPLTVEGLDEALKNSYSLHHLVKSRLARSPAEVQRSVSLGSLQGMSFLGALTAEVAAYLGAGELGDGISAAERPYAFVAVAKDGIAEFAQRVYHEVARDHLADILDAKSAEAALIAVVRRRLEDKTRLAAMPESERRRTWLLASSLFAHSEDAPDYRLAVQGLVESVAAAIAQFDYATALAHARRFAALAKRDKTLPLEWYFAPLDVLLRGDRADDLITCQELAEHVYAIGRELQQSVETNSVLWHARQAGAAAATARGDLGTAERLARESIALAKSAARQDDIRSQQNLSASLSMLGDIHYEHGDSRWAKPYYFICLKIQRRIAKTLKTPEEKSSLCQTLLKLGLCTTKFIVAERYCSEALRLARELAEATGTPEADLALSRALVGASEIYSSHQRPEDAYRLCQEGLEINRRVMEVLKTRDTTTSLVRALRRFGASAKSVGEIQVTEQSYRESLDIARRLSATLRTPQTERELSLSAVCLWNLLHDRGDSEAVPLGIEADEAMERMVAMQKRYSAPKRM